MISEPVVTNITYDSDVTKFILGNTNVSYANALRRTILADIPTVVFITTPHEDNKATFITNTSQMHNEILKQRLSCIPIHIDASSDIRDNLKNYIVEVDVENKTNTIMYVTTKDFKIKDLTTGNYLEESITRQIFPPYIPPSGSGEYFIDFAVLSPSISEEFGGEKLHFTSEMSVATARDNSMYNVVGTCSYGCTQDVEKVEIELNKQIQKWKDKSMSKEELEFEVKNWKNLEAHRCILKDSFNFVIETVGVYDNNYIISKSCKIIIDKFMELNTHIDNDTLPIATSNNILENCYDITLVNEDYTIGNILNYEIYDLFYNELKLVDYVGFNKIHPHSADSTIRVSLTDKTQSVDNVKTILKKCVERSVKKLTIINKYFDK